MLVVSIDQGGAGARSGRTGDAVRIVKRLRRRTRPSLVDPKCRDFKGLELRLPLLAMHPASPRDAILGQAFENAVMTISITRTGS